MNGPVSCTGIFQSIHRVYHPAWKRAFGVLKVLPSRTPLQVGYYRNSSFRRKLAELAPQHDGILAHLIRTGDYVRDLPMPRFLEMTDAISLAYGRRARLKSGSLLKSLAYRIEADRLLSYERTAIQSFDISILVSTVDRDHLAQSGDAGKIMICPNGVDLNAFPFSYCPDGRTIVFIGNLTSHQNLDAAVYFAGSILPGIRARHPQARLKLVGRIEGGARQSLERYEGVSVTGTIGSIPDAVRGACAGVCPIRFGAGVQSKLLEYMALGIPAVTSPVGLEGLAAVPDRHLLLASAPQQWIDRIRTLLEDRDRGRELAVAARALMERRYSWSDTTAPLCTAIQQRLNVRRTAA